jgi:hypothetical protein
MNRSRLVAGLTAVACSVTMSAAPALAPAVAQPPTKKKCVQFKTYKKNGKTYRRCAKYK